MVFRRGSATHRMGNANTRLVHKAVAGMRVMERSTSYWKNNGKTRLKTTLIARPAVNQSLWFSSFLNRVKITGRSSRAGPSSANNATNCPGLKIEREPRWADNKPGGQRRENPRAL